MKKIWLIILAALISVSCRTGSRKENSRLNKLVIDSLMTLVKEKDSALAGFITAFSNIETILGSIHEKQESLVANLNNGDEILADDISFRVNDEINSLNNLLEQNRKEIRLLNIQLASNKLENKDLDRIISNLNDQLSQKEEENVILNTRIIALNSQVRNLRDNVDTLTGITHVQSEKILEQSAWLQTAYYISGTKKELHDLNILEKTKALRLSKNFNPKNFTRVEYQELSRLPLPCKQAELASNHPKDSYAFLTDNKKNLTTLKILKVDEFWSKSKYLVIVTE